MKAYQILVTRNVTESVLVTIPAATAEEARVKLFEESIAAGVEKYGAKCESEVLGPQGITAWEPDDPPSDPKIYLGDDNLSAFEEVQI